MRGSTDPNSLRTWRGVTRRQFLGGMLAATGSLRVSAAAEARPGFVAAGPEYTFDTGVLRGTLRGGGQSKGLLPVFDAATGAPLARSLGWLSPYRLLDESHRYGKAAWDWASEARLRPDGAVEVRWRADAEHPFDLEGTYRWSAANALDLTLRLTARRELRRMEVFLASYFDGFPDTVVPVGEPRIFVGAPKDAGLWQMFPRDEAAGAIIQDGRWKHPPSPVEWTLRPRFAVPLVVRRDPARGWAVVLMTRPENCFAVALPFDGESHRSVYFSLFGRDLKDGEAVATRSRLWIGRDLPDTQVMQLYEEFRSEAKL